METVTYTITLTEAENDALSYAAVSPEEWITNMVKERARHAMDGIIDICVKACIENQVQLPMTKPEIIDLAFDNGWVKSLAEQHELVMSEMQNKIDKQSA